MEYAKMYFTLASTLAKRRIASAGIESYGYEMRLLVRSWMAG
jgi:hypothetical protein